MPLPLDDPELERTRELSSSIDIMVLCSSELGVIGQELDWLAGWCGWVQTDAAAINRTRRCSIGWRCDKHWWNKIWFSIGKFHGTQQKEISEWFRLIPKMISNDFERFQGWSQRRFNERRSGWAVGEIGGPRWGAHQNSYDSKHEFHISKLVSSQKSAVTNRNEATSRRFPLKSKFARRTRKHGRLKANNFEPFWIFLI